MRIHNARTGSPVGQPNGVFGPVDVERRLPEPISSTDDLSTHVQAPELVQFMDELHRLPEIREEVVQQATVRLADGYYMTSAAADLTALSILAG